MFSETHFQILITIIVVFFLFILPKISNNALARTLIPFLISIECITQFIFFYEKFPFFLTISIFLATLLSFQREFNILKKERDYSDFFNKKHFAYDSFRLPLGISILIIYLSLEYFLLDRVFSVMSIFLILVCLLLILYTHIPQSLSFEINFCTLFFALVYFFFFIIYLSHKFLRYFDIDVVSIQENYLMQPFLMVPLKNILTLLGFNVWSDGLKLYYEDLSSGTISAVWIATACSGFYSILFFVAAFISYVFLRFDKFELFFWSILLTGILIAYISNIMRMAIIVIVGHYYGSDALFWTHTNLGWIIFTLWIFLFWYFLDYFVKFQNKTNY